MFACCIPKSRGCR
ncbi:unnamed protein product [Gulo gulo]|uniref:Uncharacterized protein n=1 Tax=Gulo gulo TaxID=48420 RepID=A0A9X9PXI9_GULGU|nr:unnamed protein product [Gulo gulo]